MTQQLIRPGPKYVHLKVHSAYSLLEGALPIGTLAKLAAGQGFAAIALTDTNNLFGALEFSDKLWSAGVQPIVGCSIDVDFGDTREQGNTTLRPPGSAPRAKSAGRIALFAMNADGYANLMRLSKCIFFEPEDDEPAHAKIERIEAYSAGLIALTGGPDGPIDKALKDGQKDIAQERLVRLSKIFGDRLYVELQRLGAPNEAHVETQIVALAHAHRLPVVATNECYFASRDDHEAHDALLCISDGRYVVEDDRRRASPEQYLKSEAEMAALFADIPEALENTVEIAVRCAYRPLGRKPILPRFVAGDDSLSEIENFRMEAAELKQQARAGLKVRLAATGPAESFTEEDYYKRLDYEVDVITQMKFPGYFLIVADFIKWSKANGVAVGPGRGSGAGSLVAYALTITDLDPLRFGLLFERFLNPERISMPDFDIDFCQGNRDRVIDYVKAKYGRDAVSQIATFGTMAAKAALRDVGRVLGMGYGHVDSIAKLVPAPPGKSVTLKRPGEHPDPGLIYARKEAPEIEQREQKEEEVAELLALAERVEGTVRNVGMHAGGVLIAPGRITDFCPLYQQPGSDAAVSQFDKDDVEAIGLVKFDFLGLATLTILELCKDLIRARHEARRDFAFEQLALDDRATYKLLSEGKTVAVFQLESRGMQGMLRDARPSVFEDIIALVALYRPGPMDLIPSFCARKHGREEVEYPHPLMREVLEETYGIMVYQEQVMQVAQLLGGYSLGGADLLRRAMGKKKPEEMAKHRVIFAEGADKKGIAAGLANEIFSLMEKFAGYGFNKSHAAAYALLAYHTAWAKVHYPAEFTAANMSVSIDDTDKLKIFHDDAVANLGIVFEAPDVNRGGYRFEPVGERSTARRGRVEDDVGEIVELELAPQRRGPGGADDAEQQQAGLRARRDGHGGDHHRATALTATPPRRCAPPDRHSSV